MLGCNVIVLIAWLAVSAALPRPQISAGIGGSLPSLQIPENLESLLPMKPDDILETENESIPSIISPSPGSDNEPADTKPVGSLPGSVAWPVRPETTEPKPEEAPSLPGSIPWPIRPEATETEPEVPTLPGSIPWPIRPEPTEPKPEDTPSLPETISIPWPIRPEIPEINPEENPGTITIPLPEPGSISSLFPIHPETGSISLPINPETGSISLPINPEGGSILNPEAGTITLPINPETGNIALPTINPETGSIEWPVPLPERVTIDSIKENLPEGMEISIESIKEMLPEELPAMPKWLKWLIDHPTVASWLKAYVSTMFWMQRQPEMGKLPFLNPAWLKWLQERPGYLPVPSVLPEELPWWYLSQYTAKNSKNSKNSANSRYLAPFYLPYNALPQF